MIKNIKQEKEKKNGLLVYLAIILLLLIVIGSFLYFGITGNIIYNNGNYTGTDFAPPVDVFDGNNVVFNVTPDYVLSLSDNLNLEVSVNQPGAFIYGIGYYFNNLTQSWNSFNFENSPNRIGDSNWFAGFANVSLVIPPVSLKEGNNFIAVYSCKKIGINWECGCQDSNQSNCKRWMLQLVNISNLAVNYSNFLPNFSVELENISLEDYFPNIGDWGSGCPNPDRSRSEIFGPFNQTVVVRAKTSISVDDYLTINNNVVGFTRISTWCGRNNIVTPSSFYPGTLLAIIPANTPIEISNFDSVGYFSSARGVLSFEAAGSSVVLQGDEFITQLTHCQVLDQENGHYSLLNNVGLPDETCFTVVANGINIDGFGHTINGNIDASGKMGYYAEWPDHQSDGKDAYSGLVLRNVNVLGNIYSNGGVGDSSGGSLSGNGGSIFIYNSNVSYASCSGGRGAQDNAGGSSSGGSIYLENSNISHIECYGTGATSYGPEGGNGGTITLINSYGLSYVDVHGGFGSCGLDTYGGNGGTINIADSVLLPYDTRNSPLLIYDAGSAGCGGVCFGYDRYNQDNNNPDPSPYAHRYCSTNESTCVNECGSSWVTSGQQGSLNLNSVCTLNRFGELIC